MKKIDHADLISMDRFAASAPLRIDLVYARAEHPENIFNTAIYRPGAQLWLHKNLAEIVCLAAKNCYDKHGLVFVLKDGLRTMEAQSAMHGTKIVKANPHWKNGFLSLPGQGGHPRGMAIDIVLETKSGQPIDMGTPFDFLTHNPDVNPAHREYRDLPEDILKNRKILENVMMRAARDLEQELLPLPMEWWDFRFPKEIVTAYAPLSDEDLPAEMRMTFL